MLDPHIQAALAGRGADFRSARSSVPLFNPLNLGHWIDVCQFAGVPFVPAGEIARILVGDVVMFDVDPAPASIGPFFEKVYDEMQRLGEGWMVRWSCCSCMEVKHRLGTGSPEWHPDFARLAIDDMRAYDLVDEFPEETIAAYARPWVKAQIIDGYPVEYRVFVEDDVVIGISNYYPQRPLPNNAITLGHLTEVHQLTNQLIAAQDQVMNCVQIEKTHDITKNHFTADFVVTEDKGMLFLEGGPPSTPKWGAHPCCFATDPVSGIALESRERPY